MLIFRYDKTFEGLLTAIFDAYSIKRFPDVLLAAEDTSPLFYDEIITVVTDEERSNRVWKGLQKKLSASALTSLTTCWLSELPEIDLVLFRYIHKAIDAPRSIELNFGDPDVLELSKVWKKVNNERLRVMQFLRFQKAADGTFFAAVEPEKNALPLAIDHFKDRFADQPWLIYDIKRAYGFYYDLKEVSQEEWPICQPSPKYTLNKKKDIFKADSSTKVSWIKTKNFFKNSGRPISRQLL